MTSDGKMLSEAVFGSGNAGKLIAGRRTARASRRPPGAADTGTYRVNITPTTFDTPGFSETFLHELMHVSGYAHIDQKDEDGKNDRVNTCASYCSGCIKDNRPSETLGQDCARCSEPGKKEQCGIRKGKIRSSMCHRDHLAACLQGDYKVAVDCKKCLRGGTRLCDDTPVGEDGMPLCCEICPDNTAENIARRSWRAVTVTGWPRPSSPVIVTGSRSRRRRRRSRCPTSRCERALEFAHSLAPR